MSTVKAIKILVHFHKVTIKSWIFIMWCINFKTLEYLIWSKFLLWFIYNILATQLTACTCIFVQYHYSKNTVKVIKILVHFHKVTVKRWIFINFKTYKSIWSINFYYGPFTNKPATPPAGYKPNSLCKEFNVKICVTVLYLSIIF